MRLEKNKINLLHFLLGYFICYIAIYMLAYIFDVYNDNYIQEAKKVEQGYIKQYLELEDCLVNDDQKCFLSKVTIFDVE